MDQLAGQTLIVTGGASGLGAAVAEAAAALGARVAILDRNEVEGRAVADRVGGRFWRMDVGAAEDWTRLVPEIEAALGAVRFAHLNAGIMSRSLDAALAPPGLTDFPLDRYRAAMAVNIDGVFLGMRALLPRITAAGGGAITATASAAGVIPIAFDPVYAMTKHAVVGLVRSLALAFADGPVRINAICPGGFSSALLPDGLESPETMTPAEVAGEVIDLLRVGATGEVRAKLAKGIAGRSVRAADITLRG